MGAESIAFGGEKLVLGGIIHRRAVERALDGHDGLPVSSSPSEMAEILMLQRIVFGGALLRY